MASLKRLAFILGLLLGLAAVAAAGTVILTYLFTGRFPAIELAGKEPRVELMTADEVVTLIREQVDRAKMAQASGGAGGEADDRA
jgi:hypothetical protein